MENTSFTSHNIQSETNSPEQAREHILSYISEKHGLDGNDLTRAEQAAEARGEPPEQVLTKLGLISEAALVDAYHHILEIPILSKEDYPHEAILTSELSHIFLKNAQVIPITQEDDTIYLAMVNPLDDFSLKSIALKLNCDVKPVLLSHSDFKKLYDFLYGDGLNNEETDNNLSNDLASKDLEKLKEQASDAPIIRLVDRIIFNAIEAGASDIHISAIPQGAKLRYRVDGHLETIEPFPLTERAAILSRLKIMAQLDIAEQRLPQDGRIKINYRGREVDIRIATVRQLHGESAVLRILDRSGVSFEFSDLGFEEFQVKQIQEMLQTSHGILLVTGPTGSGKTTTLYSALTYLNRDDIHIISIEDPVEYQLANVNQIQVQSDIGLDFAKSLRSVLRLDPDIVMLGEIRDSETAKIANQAALTGHLVLATLHTNTALGAIPRLIDMGVENYLLSSTIRGVIAQRLVRNLCNNCKLETPIPEDIKSEIEGFGLDLPGPSKNSIYKAKGCEACNFTGYKGRSVISEIVPISKELKSVISSKEISEQILQSHIDEQNLSMYKHGLYKVALGITSLSEVYLVTTGA